MNFILLYTCLYPYIADMTKIGIPYIDLSKIEVQDVSARDTDELFRIL